MPSRIVTQFRPGVRAHGEHDEAEDRDAEDAEQRAPDVVVDHERIGQHRRELSGEQERGRFALGEGQHARQRSLRGGPVAVELSAGGRGQRAQGRQARIVVCVCSGVSAPRCERRRLVAPRAQPVGDDPEVAPPDLGVDVARALAQRAEHELQQRHVGRLDVGAQAAVGLGARDEPGDEREHELAGAGDALEAVRAGQRDLLEAAVAGVLLGRALEEAHEPGPRIVGVQARPRPRPRTRSCASSNSASMSCSLSGKRR